MGKIVLLTFVVFVAILGSTDAGKKGCEGKKYDKMVKAHKKCLKAGFRSKLGCKTGVDKELQGKVLKKCKRAEKKLKKCGYKCDKVTATNGGWSDFSAWSDCSAECDGGTQSQSRSCDNPAPSNGGADCKGDATASRVCNTDPCKTTANYVIKITTGDETNAGTNNWVYMTISGTRGSTEEVGLDTTGNDMVRGATDTHELTLKNVGKIQCAQFRIKGTDGWLAQRVMIYENDKLLFDSGELGVWLDDNMTKKFCGVPRTNYKIELKTSDLTNANTDDKIFMTIIGSDGSTNEVELNIKGKNDRERGSIDEHNVSLEDVGDVQCVQFRIAGRDGWNVAQVRVFQSGNVTFDSGALGVWLDDNATKKFC